MKKVLTLISLLLMFVAVSCDNTDSALTEMAKLANEKCPLQIDYLTTMDKVEYDPASKRYIYYYTIDDNVLPMTSLMQNSKTLAENIKNQLNNPSEEMEKELEALKAADAIIEYYYTGENTGKSFYIRYNPEDKNCVITLSADEVIKV